MPDVATINSGLREIEASRSNMTSEAIEAAVERVTYTLPRNEAMRSARRRLSSARQEATQFSINSANPSNDPMVRRAWSRVHALENELRAQRHSRNPLDEAIYAMGGRLIHHASPVEAWTS